MLVLSRKIGESIVIAGEINVRVLEISGSRVRIGIDAPHSVSVHRSEVFHSIQEFQAPVGVRELVGT